MSATGQTVRHQKIAETDPAFPPELTQAESDIEKKDYAAAEPLLQKVVAADPKNYRAWFDLGFVYNGLGNLTESIAAYRKSVAAKPDVFESNLNLGISLAKAGQTDAEQYLRAATTLKPTVNVDEGHARAWLSLAALLETNKPDQAIEAYQRAAVLTPKDPEPHLAAGALLEKGNRFADAEQEYKQALAIDPGSSEALIGLANIYTRGNRFLDAEQILGKIVALHPENVQARLELGRVLVRLGKNDEAMASVQAAIKLDPGNPKIQRELADLYMSAKKYDQAEATYRSLLNGKSPDLAELHYLIGVALLKQRKFPEAEQEFLVAVKLKPDMGEAYGDLAVAAVENKDYPLAIKAADARAKFLPEIPIGYFLRASAYDHLRAYKPAAENYHKFLEVANGQFPDQEWQARHRLIAIEPKK
ncbi:MAG TPA: tetratricopeptide repeat protein [Terriglobales bacterium]|jgi:tetratricopeptide (TPR) repeat protein|nr:tetratricopeptide repeat protein [Terriglobales bacterium]